MSVVVFILKLQIHLKIKCILSRILDLRFLMLSKVSSSIEITCFALFHKMNIPYISNVCCRVFNVCSAYEVSNRKFLNKVTNNVEWLQHCPGNTPKNVPNKTLLKPCWNMFLDTLEGFVCLILFMLFSLLFFTKKKYKI